VNVNLSIDKGSTPLDSSAKVLAPGQKPVINSKPAPPEVCDPHNFSGDTQNFDDSYYGRQFIAYDPSTGKATFYKTKEEMDAALAAINDRRKQDLMLASSGSPQAVAAIIRNNKLPTENKAAHNSYEEDSAAVLSAARSELGSLTAGELIALSSEYPELKSLADEKISHAKLRGIPPESAVNMKVSEIDEMSKQKIAPPKLVQSI
jgi:hypothetical protein